MFFLFLEKVPRPRLSSGRSDLICRAKNDDSSSKDSRSNAAQCSEGCGRCLHAAPAVLPLADHPVADIGRSSSRLVFNACDRMLHAGIDGPNLQLCRQLYRRHDLARLTEQRENVTLIAEDRCCLVHDAAGRFGDDVLHPLACLSQFDPLQLDSIRSRRRLSSSPPRRLPMS